MQTSPISFRVKQGNRRLLAARRRRNLHKKNEKKLVLTVRLIKVDVSNYSNICNLFQLFLVDFLMTWILQSQKWVTNRMYLCIVLYNRSSLSGHSRKRTALLTTAYPIWTQAHTNSVSTHSRKRPVPVVDSFSASRGCSAYGSFDCNTIPLKPKTFSLA